MWPFSLIRKLKKKVKDLENFNEHLQEANRHLFEMYKREKFELDAHTQDCIEAYCADAGIDYIAIKSPQQYYEWIWHELTFLELTKALKEYETFVSNADTGMFRAEGDIVEFQGPDTGDN